MKNKKGTTCVKIGIPTIGNLLILFRFWYDVLPFSLATERSVLYFCDYYSSTYFNREGFMPPFKTFWSERVACASRATKVTTIGPSEVRAPAEQLR